MSDSGIPIALGGDKAYPGNLTTFVTFTCVVAALGGLIFGYDIGISGGVSSMDSFLKKFFLSVYQLQSSTHKLTNQYCRYNSQTLTLFTSALYLAASLSSLVASIVTRKLGRKLSMLVGGVLFCAGAVINGFAQAFWMLVVGRILLGFGIGFATQSVPLYLSEMAPYKYRGSLNTGFQLSITIGILAANIFNYFNNLDRKSGWRLSLGGAAVPALAVTVGSLILPETPNSMIERGIIEDARTKLRRIRGIDDVDEEFKDLIYASEKSRKIEHQWRNLLQKKYIPQLTMAILIPFFQQMTGANVIVFYAPVLFKTIGFGNEASLISAVVTGTVNVLASCVSIYGVDKWGRRFLFLEGGAQMLICQVAVASFIGIKFGVNGDPGDLPKWYAIMVVFFICIHIAGFAWSWGPLGWLVPSEIFPLEIRSAAQSINVSVNMFFTFLIAQSFLTMLCHFKFGLFLFFAFWIVVMTMFVYMFLLETKNIPIEEMVIVWKKHWFWSRFMADVDYPNAVELNEEVEVLTSSDSDVGLSNGPL